MVSHTFDHENQVVICRVGGRFGLLRVSDHLQALFAAPATASCAGALVVAADQTVIPPFHLVRFLNPLLDAWIAERGPEVWAFVLPGDAARRMAERVLEHLQLEPIEARCFVSEPEARQWLTARIRARAGALAAAHAYA